MYIPDQPQNDAFAWATNTSACEQRGCPISDAAGMKKRKRDTTNWDNQVNASMGSCTAFIPGNAQHVDDKFRNGYSQLLGESSSGSITSKFAPWPIPERRTHQFRPCLQPTAIKRRRLIQQNQQNQQSLQEWSTIPISMYAGPKPQHLYSTDPGSSLPSTPTIPKSPSSSLHKTKPNTHHNNDPSTSSSQNKPSSNITLFPCHICHRRPTTRSTLDAYADCDLCAERPVTSVYESVWLSIATTLAPLRTPIQAEARRIITAILVILSMRMTVEAKSPVGGARLRRQIQGQDVEGKKRMAPGRDGRCVRGVQLRVSSTVARRL
ncbi:predicted protein [Histoplasma capsulatum H143]|uniref:Uncharacterized protein n=1 Tax=Ajellomyces capsulatus (strain H143) TaxID=544712 RepID=C6HAZ4_AJECH|nr:predicted protein [Histoplasma capsulatum H143]